MLVPRLGIASDPSTLGSFAKPTWYDVVRVVLGLVLLLAAGLKGQQLATESLMASGILGSPWIAITIVEFELIFGLWLLVGLRPRATRIVAVVCFSVLALASLHKVVTGEHSCGCFGNWEIRPLYTLMFDVIAIIVLWGALPKTNAGHCKQKPAFTVPEFVVCAALFAVPSALVMAHYSTTTIGSHGLTVGAGRTVVLSPEAWIGRRFPLLQHIDSDPEFVVGEWTIVIFRNNCSKCHALIKNLIRSGKKPTGGRDDVVFLEVPPYGAEGNRLMHAGWRVIRLVNSHKWFVTTPVTLRLRDGVVTSCTKSMVFEA